MGIVVPKLHDAFPTVYRSGNTGTETETHFFINSLIIPFPNGYHTPGEKKLSQSLSWTNNCNRFRKQYQCHRSQDWFFRNLLFYLLSYFFLLCIVWVYRNHYRTVHILRNYEQWKLNTYFTYYAIQKYRNPWDQGRMTSIVERYRFYESWAKSCFQPILALYW